MKKKLYLISFVLLTFTISCEKEIETVVSETEIDFNGDWKVSAFNDTTFIYGPFKIITQHEAYSDSITIKDSEIKFWKFQIKADANFQKGTFGTELSNCEVSSENVGVIISKGKIINSDSIYFEIQFEDDETPFVNTYNLKGTRIK